MRPFGMGESWPVRHLPHSTMRLYTGSDQAEVIRKANTWKPKEGFSMFLTQQLTATLKNLKAWQAEERKRQEALEERLQEEAAAQAAQAQAEAEERLRQERQEREEREEEERLERLELEEREAQRLREDSLPGWRLSCLADMLCFQIFPTRFSAWALNHYFRSTRGIKSCNFGRMLPTQGKNSENKVTGVPLRAVPATLIQSTNDFCESWPWWVASPHLLAGKDLPGVLIEKTMAVAINEETNDPRAALLARRSQNHWFRFFENMCDHVRICDILRDVDSRWQMCWVEPADWKVLSAGRSGAAAQAGRGAKSGSGVAGMHPSREVRVSVAKGPKVDSWMSWMSWKHSFLRADLSLSLSVWYIMIYTLI